MTKREPIKQRMPFTIPKQRNGHPGKGCQCLRIKNSITPAVPVRSGWSNRMERYCSRSILAATVKIRSL